jgi:hypothetical protein
MGLNAQTNDTLSTNVVWVKFDSEAEFPNGSRAFNLYWQQNFKCKKCKKIGGEGKIEFVIMEDGSIQNIKIKQPLSPDADEAARVAVEKMPRWKPAYYKGAPVSSVYIVSYWQESYSIWTGNMIRIPTPDITKNFHWSFGLWLGAVHHSENLATYFNPVRMILGLGFAAHYKRLGLGFSYDLIGYSKLKNPILYNNLTLSPNDNIRGSGINAFFPISYRVMESKKLWLAPYIAPTFNNLTLKQEQKDAVDMSTPSLTFGLNFDYISDRTGLLPYGSSLKKNVITSCIHGSFFINPFQFNKANTTSFNTTAIGIRLGIYGYFQREK